jgi:hypothetical protein
MMPKKQALSANGPLAQGQARKDRAEGTDPANNQKPVANNPEFVLP